MGRGVRGHRQAPGTPTPGRRPASGIRVGGLYLCDNTLSAGSWTILEDDPSAEAVRVHNAAIAEDERYLSTIVPTREGVLVALRVA